MPKRPTTLAAEQLKTRPGKQYKMKLQPETINPTHHGSGKLQHKVAIISGGDSGIGRAVAVAFAREGADIVFCFLNEHTDAQETIRLVKAEGRSCEAIAGDVGNEAFCKHLVDYTLQKFGKIDIVINNAAEQHPVEKLEAITAGQLERTFRSNIFSMFFLTKAALPHLKSGSAIVNTTSVTAYKGNAELLDYSSTKGAIVAFTQSLSMSVIGKGIRVNAVAPGPIWTPLIPSTFSPEHVKNFGKNTPMGRAGQPDEVALAYVYLASNDASYVSGQTLHVNGGVIVNS